MSNVYLEYKFKAKAERLSKITTVLIPDKPILTRFLLAKLMRKVVIIRNILYG